MSDISPLPPPEPTYRAIEATLAGHEPGRRFLAEHARRSRHAETSALLDAVARLHAHSAEAAGFAGQVETDLPALRDLTAAAEASLGEAAGSAPNGDDDDVFDMVERLQETAWTLREAGSDASLCDLLDALALRLSRACRAREQRDHALAGARDAVGRIGRHLADLATRLARTGSGPEAPESDARGLPAGGDTPASDGDDPAGASEPARPKQSGSRRRARPRSVGPDRG